MYTCPYSLMVAQVNQYLDDLAMSNTKKDRPGMRKALQLLLRNTSGLEQKWLIRIILKVCVPSKEIFYAKNFCRWHDCQNLNVKKKCIRLSMAKYCDKKLISPAKNFQSTVVS